MIKYFAVENFRSIKEENIIEFDSGIPKDSPFVANPTIGIAGANASEKSSLLQALNFTIWFMQDSFLSQDEDKEIPLDAFVRGKNDKVINPAKNIYVLLLKGVPKKIILSFLSYFTNKVFMSKTAMVAAPKKF